jgi:hypothetical protein
MEWQKIKYFEKISYLSIYSILFFFKPFYSNLHNITFEIFGIQFACNLIDKKSLNNYLFKNLKDGDC